MPSKLGNTIRNSWAGRQGICYGPVGLWGADGAGVGRAPNPGFVLGRIRMCLYRGHELDGGHSGSTTKILLPQCPWEKENKQSEIN